MNNLQCHRLGLAGTNAAASQPAEPSLVSLGTPVTFFGGSFTYGDTRDKCFAYWVGLALNGRLLHPQIFDKNQSTASGVMAAKTVDDSSDVAARIGTINTHNGVYIYLPGEHDLNTMDAATQQGYFDDIFTELSGAEKIYVIPFADTKDAAADSAITTRNTTNLAWLRSNAGSTYANVTVLSDDVWDGIELHDGMGGNGADSYDGNYPDTGGAYKLGVNIVSEITDDIAEGDAFDYVSNYTNIYPADFSGTGGTARTGTSGDVADGLDLYASNTTGLTIVGSKGTLNGSDSQIFTVTGTSPAGNVDVYIRESITANIDTGYGVLMVGNIKVTASDGSSAPVGLQGIGMEGIYGKHTFGNKSSPANEGVIDFVVEGIFMTFPEEETTDRTSFTGDLAGRMVPSTTVDVRIELSNIQMFSTEADNLFF